ncbi:ribosome maturation factor RimM [Siccirubricoccus phaeus]|uniref:ribosome maturation factor RimM n=1 Tax=Siccirubricoccus phaeus TaxID=2595053 RepID=UPI0011F3ACF2|nr:ribosome maturation factor RimM [Siccirubricoccus phaeus]
MAGKRILVGEIGRPHGVRGLVKLRSFTADPDAIADYGPLTDEAGTRQYRVVLLGDGLARVDGVTDRDGAAKLTGTRLYVERAALPPPEPEEYYLADLVGLAVETPEGQPLGTVRAVEEHGAGSFLVVQGRKELLLPFTRAVVPVVDLVLGKLTAIPPDEVVVPPSAPSAQGEAAE